MMGVPALFQAMLASPDVERRQGGFLVAESVLLGAAALMAATKERFEALTHGRIIEGYSLTEGMMACLVNPMKGQRQDRLDRHAAA